MDTPKNSTVYTNARIKAYPSKTVLQVATKAIFPLEPGAPQKRPYDVPPPGHASNPDRAIQESQRRAKARVRDIALCNHFEYFFTWTLNGDLIDRYDATVIYSKVRIFLGNAVQRKGFAYVLVPEYHTQKAGEDKPAIHMHGLCDLGEVPIVRANSKTGKPLNDKRGRPIYNMPTWTWGFSSCVPVDKQYERTVNYLTKYITKSDRKIFGKWYLCSRNINKFPSLIPLEPVRYDKFRNSHKLNICLQQESKICDGLYLLTEEFPKLENTSKDISTSEKGATYDE